MLYMQFPVSEFFKTLPQPKPFPKSFPKPFQIFFPNAILLHVLRALIPTYASIFMRNFLLQIPELVFEIKLGSFGCYGKNNALFYRSSNISAVQYRFQIQNTLHSFAIVTKLIGFHALCKLKRSKISTLHP